MPQAAHPPSRDAKERSESQVVAFPRSPEEERPSHNLPLELTSFIGREWETAEVKRLLLEGNRLLTLTGPGGCGKTRLALAVAFEVVEGFERGVWLVELASLSDPDLVAQAVASVLEVREAPGRSLTEVLAEHLKYKKLLLVLDNCEHLIDACATLTGSLLRSCPDVRVLASSREALGVAGEITWPVPSLSVPDPGHLPPIEDLTRYEAVRLFVERAKSAVPSFELTERHAPAVARMCWKLDGIPLAIELAAARARVLAVEQIASRLEDNLRLLKTESRTVNPRQQTLSATIDWSYELLSEQERVLFRRLAVFAGGWTLEAAEEVCAGEGTEEFEVLDLLSRLVDKSLVSVAEQQGGEVRYRLLETIRQYGAVKLGDSGEESEVRRRHANFFLKLAEDAEPELKGPLQEAWMEHLEREHDNLRVALSWALKEGEAILGLRLGGALGEFWYMRGNLSEGRSWLEAVLVNGTEAPESARAKALARAGWIAREQGDYEHSVALTEESLALAQRLGDRASAATALYTLGWAALFQNELERAFELAEEAIRLQRELNDKGGVAHALTTLGYVANVQHDYERAMALHDESLALAREAEDGFAVVLSLGVGATASLGLGDHRRTRMLCEEGLKLSQRLGIMHLTAGNLHALASLAGSQGQPIRSARLWGAAESLLKAIGSTFTSIERNFYRPYIDAARAQVDEAAWEAAWEEGRTMTLEKAVEYALLEEDEPTPPQKETAGLTVREVEVLRLVAEGLTDPQVAERLYLSPRTVNHHMSSIYRKLDVSSRAAAAKEASKRGLI